MYECAIAYYLEMVSFLWSTIPQTWVPDQRHDNGTTINQINSQCRFTDSDTLSNGLLKFNELLASSHFLINATLVA